MNGKLSFFIILRLSTHVSHFNQGRSVTHGIKRSFWKLMVHLYDFSAQISSFHMTLCYDKLLRWRHFWMTPYIITNITYVITLFSLAYRIDETPYNIKPRGCPLTQSCYFHTPYKNIGYPPLHTGYPIYTQGIPL